MRFWASKQQPLFTVLSYVLPVFILAAIWLLPISHYYVPTLSITGDMIKAACRQPDDAIFDEIRSFFQSPKVEDEKKLIAKAEKILKGKSVRPGGATISFTFPFDARDLDKKEPGWQLSFASLAIPSRLLRAYQVNKTPRFLLAAGNMISAFAKYERSTWLPKGLLWNDHAIAARISVIAKFWKFYRNHPGYDPEIARDVFRLVARSRELLAKPSHFTFSTNHGIMQNLALLQICLAFPALPETETYKELAFERLRDQMGFYVNDEGVVLEHSAGYQRVGVEFLSMAFRYLTLLDIPISENWGVKYGRAKEFYAQLRRPDGSLPMFGDTGLGRDSLGPLVTETDDHGRCEMLTYKNDWVPNKSNSLYPVAGYSVWWDGLDKWPDEVNLKQTVVVWSHFPGHAHKHADEMSVLLWAGGQTWWTNVGYWPYGMKGRSEAVSWAGSNAPHLANEDTHSERNTTLLAYGSSDFLNMIDLQRNWPNEYIARRQVIYLKPNVWIVIDHFSGNENDQNVITWTTASDVRLCQGQVPGTYALETETAQLKLNNFILVSGGAEIKQFKGSFKPFAGWEMTQPASAIRVVQPANDSWVATIWTIQGDDKPVFHFIEPPAMNRWKGPEDWEINFKLSSGPLSIKRKENRVFFTQIKDAKIKPIKKQTKLTETPQPTNQLAKIHAAFNDAAKKYPRKSFSMRRQMKTTYFVFLLFLLQEVFFLIFIRFRRIYCTTLRGFNAFGWIAVGVWLFGVYL